MSERSVETDQKREVAREGWIGGALIDQTRPKVLDAYCCAGGTGMGLHRAGFDVEGIDLHPSADYPFRQHQGDAVEFIRERGHEYAAIVGGPPCQAHTTLTKGNRGRGWTDTHGDLIAATREAMIATGRPYVIENVMGAKAQLIDPVMLCGLSFGLRVFRHRLFESNVPLSVPEHPSHRGHRVSGWRHGVNHHGDMVAVYGDGGGKGSVADWQTAMGIYWTADKARLAEAIPPAYSEYLGSQLLTHVRLSRLVCRPEALHVNDRSPCGDPSPRERPPGSGHWWCQHEQYLSNRPVTAEPSPAGRRLPIDDRHPLGDLVYRPTQPGATP